MFELKETYTFETNLSINLIEYSNIYFDDEEELFSYFLFFISDFIDYRKLTDRSDLINFINWNIKNNSEFNDCIYEESFMVLDNKIIFNEFESKLHCSLLGYFIIDCYLVYATHKFLFIKDKKNNKSYRYYFD